MTGGSAPAASDHRFDAVGAIIARSHWHAPCIDHPNCCTSTCPPSGCLCCPNQDACNFTRGSGTLVAPNIVVFAKHVAHSNADDCDEVTVWDVRFRRRLDDGIGQVDLSDNNPQTGDLGADSFFHARVACFIDVPNADIALAILEEPVTHIEPIPIRFRGPNELLPEGRRIYVAGWGLGAPDIWVPGTSCSPLDWTYRLKVA